MRTITGAVAAVATVCAIGIGVAGCGANSGPKLSGTVDTPTTAAPTSLEHTGTTATEARATELASIARELASMKRDLDDAGTAIDGTDVDKAKQQEGSAP